MREEVKNTKKEAHDKIEGTVECWDHYTLPISPTNPLVSEGDKLALKVDEKSIRLSPTKDLNHDIIV